MRDAMVKLMNEGNIMSFVNVPNVRKSFKCMNKNISDALKSRNRLGVFLIRSCFFLFFYLKKSSIGPVVNSKFIFLPDFLGGFYNLEVIFF